MELNFSEIDQYNETLEQQNYWDIQNKPSTEQPKKRNKVTFDDILSNMNLVVNNKGVLQYMVPLQKESEYPNTYTYYQNQPQINPSQIRVNRQPEKPLEPEVKNSAIFNKYFKDYRDPNASQQQSNIRVPKTIEEYKQMVLEDKIKRIQEINRIAQIKSTKLLFTNVGNIQATKNGLRKMGFN